jgi:3-hydroxyisobutyrate dehydrogenase
MAKPRIGFLGMGAMGGPMARRLVQMGFSVTGYDVSEARAAAAKDGITMSVGVFDRDSLVLILRWSYDK